MEEQEAGEQPTAVFVGGPPELCEPDNGVHWLGQPLSEVGGGGSVGGWVGGGVGGWEGGWGGGGSVGVRVKGGRGGGALACRLNARPHPRRPPLSRYHTRPPTQPTHPPAHPTHPHRPLLPSLAGRGAAAVPVSRAAHAGLCDATRARRRGVRVAGVTLHALLPPPAVAHFWGARLEGETDEEPCDEVSERMRPRRGPAARGGGGGEGGPAALPTPPLHTPPPPTHTHTHTTTHTPSTHTPSTRPPPHRLHVPPLPPPSPPPSLPPTRALALPPSPPLCAHAGVLG